MRIISQPRRLVTGVAIVCLVLALAVPLGLRFSLALLCVEAAKMPDQLNAIVVLGGGYNHRALYAVEIYRSVSVSNVLVVGGGDAEAVAAVLISKGIPSDQIRLESLSRNTMQNARLSVPMLRQSGVRRVGVVTSWFHSRRALACFRKAAPDMEFVSLPTRLDRPANRWPNKWIRNSVLLEYLKLAGYFIRYQVWSF